MEVLKEKPRLNLKSNTVNNVVATLEGITFRGVNAYLRVRIQNNSSGDFLVGKMLQTWYKDQGTGLNLTAAYVTGFPIIEAGKEATIVYAAKAVNAFDDARLYFTIGDRLKEANVMEIPITGEIYNKEMMR
jgi:hypothetical protein